jgi:competence protein ComFC
MIKISPKKIKGEWVDGYALDFHTAGSVYIGDDEYGHPQFDTTRTSIGELLYRLKYGGDESVIEPIVTTAGNFVRSRSWPIDLIIPVPASRSRPFQPVVALAKRLAEELKVAFCGGCVAKVKEIPELKNIFDFNERTKLLGSAFQVNHPKVKGKHVLLFDDLCRSGATINAVSSELKKLGKVASIYALTLTMTRRRR